MFNGQWGKRPFPPPILPIFICYLQVNGRYLTRAWPPHSLIPDSHPLTLPADLPPGRYHLSVGLYLLETGLRLPVTAADGTPHPHDAFNLPEFIISQ